MKPLLFFYGMQGADRVKAGDRPALYYTNNQTLWQHLNRISESDLRKVGFEQAAIHLPALSSPSQLTAL
jgi:hypothetical protein